MAAIPVGASMSAVTTWYNGRFANFRRANRNDIEAQRPQGRDAVITMAQVTTPSNARNNNNDSAAANNNTKEKKKQDTLFGPNIGIVSGGPDWTERTSDGKLVDELTPEIVKGWIAKSKETNHSTTTLQALVNLKRPTLRLSPLEPSESDDPTHIDSQHHHGLEFEYDCDAPKCGIYVHIILSPSHHLADKSLSAMGKPTKMCVFEVVTQGGFGRLLKLEEGAMLELGRWEYRESPHPALGSGLQVHGPSGSVDRISTDDATTSAAAAHPAEASDQSPATAGSSPTQRQKKRFTTFHFRKRTTDRNVAGPALAVLDAESSSSPSNNPSTSPNADTNGTGNGTNAEKKGEAGGAGEKEEEGVKVTIKLMALDEDGKELESVNEQVTYLHVVRFGAKPVMGMAGVGAGGGATAANPTTNAEAEGEEESKDAKDTKENNVHATATPQVEEDKRPWVVKVVKREATIGPHTFHLHEIYGLSSNSTTSAHAVPPPPTLNTDTNNPTTPANAHSYPPTTPSITVTTQPHQQQEDEPSSECLLCLSSPREVVLLPCRHLVACRECAVNMIEFGAGGTIVHSEPDPPAATPSDDAAATGTGTGAGGAPTGGDAAATAATPGAGEAGEAGPGVLTPPVMVVPAVNTGAVVAPAPTTRRKRKAKGWFCPVCRQPYTSLLRITTVPPAKDMGDDETKESSEGEMSPPQSPATGPGGNLNGGGGGLASAAVVVDGEGEGQDAATATTGSSPRTGRRGFLRAFTRGGGQGDLESGTAWA